MEYFQSYIVCFDKLHGEEKSPYEEEHPKGITGLRVDDMRKVGVPFIIVIDSI